MHMVEVCRTESFWWDFYSEENNKKNTFVIFFVKNDKNMELNTTVLSKNEHVCSVSKSQEYNPTLKM